MGPSLKRLRTKAPPLESPAVDTPAPGAEENVSQQPRTPATDTAVADRNEDIASVLRPLEGESSYSKQLNPRSSWYGTWPRKSTASTQVARETILANKLSNVPSTEPLDRLEPKKSPTTSISKPPPSMNLGKGKETLDVTMGGTFEENNTASKGASCSQPAAGPEVQLLNVGTIGKNGPGKSSFIEQTKRDSESTEIDTKKNKMGNEPLVDKDKQEPEPVAPHPTTSSGWLGGWFGWSEPQVVSQPQELPTEPDPKIPPTEGSTVVAEPASANTEDHSNVAVESVTKKPASTLWFGLWSTAPPSTSMELVKEPLPMKTVEIDQDTVMEDAPSTNPTPKATQPAAGSSWAFWSTDSTKKSGPEKSEEAGQLAIVGETSQTKIEPPKAATTKESKTSRSSKRSRAEITEAVADNAPPPEPASIGTTAQNTPSPKTSPPNLLLPSVRSTYRLFENPSIIQQIARLLLLGKQQSAKHVFLTKDHPKIKKALAIGIHGLFPAPLLRTVIGQPTGTSIRFANHAAAAIRRWTDKNGSVDCEIEKVALEGEGKIAERVDNLWKLLLNWIDHVRQADFILIACHSQGVPVAIMLIAKLIEFGVVSTGRIGVCAMAGISLGPFPDYKSRLFSGSAGELFEFADPDSVVSQRYETSLRVALSYGVKVAYCGSIDDQLVSMESSTFSIASHPYIYRAVFVDGRIHAPDFLSHLVGFALKLRNLGVPDHGLIRELSAPLAGSLYTGEGHSRLYDDGNVYDLAIEFALETTSVGDVPLDLKKYEIPNNVNPYVLPWIMRGLLEEDFVKTELSQETTDLLKQFDDWKPSTKVLKDVKYRLEAVRSKL